MKNKDNYEQVGKEALVYHPSKVSWSVSNHISRENPTLSRISIYTVLTLFIVFISYANFSQIAISISSEGRLDYKVFSPLIINKNDLQIKKIYVKNNQEIKKGETLLLGKAQLTNNALKIMKSNKIKIESLVLKDQKGLCTSKCIAKLIDFSNSSFSFNEQIKAQGSLKDYLSNLSNSFKSYVNSLKERDNYQESTQGLRIKIKDIEEKIINIEKKSAQDILKMEYQQLKSEKVNLTSQLNEKKSSLESRISQNRNSFLVTLKNYTTQVKDYINSNQVKAPQSGIVIFQTDIIEGQFLPARTNLFKILPKKGTLYGKSLIGNKDISKVKKGDKVKLSIDALPEREYGPVWGEVESIAISPTEDPKTKELKYETLIRLKTQNLKDYQGNIKEFKLGLSYKAQIITKYESLLKVSISKLLNIKDEYLGDVF